MTDFQCFMITKCWFRLTLIIYCSTIQKQNKCKFSFWSSLEIIRKVTEVRGHTVWQQLLVQQSGNKESQIGDAVMRLAWVFVCFLVQLFRPASADVGNLCRCVCDGVTKRKSTILIPSTFGCQECTSSLCQKRFSQCGRKNTVSTHCVDRYALAPRIAIVSLFVLIVLLTIISIFKERLKGLRRFAPRFGVVQS